MIGDESPADLLAGAFEHFSRADTATTRRLASAVVAGDDPALRAQAMALLVRCHQILDEQVEALVLAQEAFEVCWAIGDTASEAIIRGTVARILLVTTDPVTAMAEIMTAMELAEASGDLRARMSVTATASVVYFYLEQFDHCFEYCERAAEMARLLGDDVTNGAMIDTMACANMALAESARAAGDEARALELSALAQGQSREAIVIARRKGNRWYEATAMGNLAESLSFCGRAGEAVELFDGWHLDLENDPPSIVNHILDTHGCICLADGRYEEAVDLLRRALDVAESKAGQMVVAEHLSDAYERQGDLRGALDAYKLFHALSKEVASESARRSGSIAAVRMQTTQAKAAAEEERARVTALQHANQELLRQTRQDPLTGLANRRHLDELMAQGLSGHALLLIDVDHFKRVNDEHSHLIGDQVLRRLAGLLQSACRDEDTVVRFGGEEFAILLPHADLPKATTIAERLRARVTADAWHTVAPGLTITVSVGLALGDESADPAVVLATADERLYAAKHAGRNRVHGPALSESVLVSGSPP
ncbi:MAG TPA: tetratricopeptide repeat-containing diguanylate cyclase [Actinoplanes sp.]|nr:tetratricopeptide repeat-containing diguanylate cyclase [Actinoplanes sp.]